MSVSDNPFGQQVARYIAGQTTVSLHDEAGQWLGDYDGAGRPIRQVVWLDSLPVAALDGDHIRDIQADHLGTPRVVIDRSTDKAIWQWRVVDDSFGNDAPIEDPDKDGTNYAFDMRFPGQRFDAVTGLFQNGWRDYDPTSGRYVQSDPIGLAGGVSTYTYVGSNPYMRVDPQGLDDTQCMYNPGACGWSRNPQVSNVNAGVGAWGNLLAGFGGQRRVRRWTALESSAFTIRSAGVSSLGCPCRERWALLSVSERVQLVWGRKRRTEQSSSVVLALLAVGRC